MAKTFNRLIEEKFLSRIFDELAAFIDDEHDLIDFRFQAISEPEEYILNDIHLKHIFI